MQSICVIKASLFMFAYKPDGKIDQSQTKFMHNSIISVHVVPKCYY